MDGTLIIAAWASAVSNARDAWRETRVRPQRPHPLGMERRSRTLQQATRHRTHHHLHAHTPSMQAHDPRPGPSPLLVPGDSGYIELKSGLKSPPPGRSQSGRSRKKVQGGGWSLAGHGGSGTSLLRVREASPLHSSSAQEPLDGLVLSQVLLLLSRCTASLRWTNS